MSFIKDFKEFAMRGNVMDMAVGIIIGGAFGKITTSLVNDIIMPPIGLLISGVNFSDLAIKIPSPLDDAAPVTINYGEFIQVTLNFIIVAFAVFLLIKVINLARRKQEEAAAAPPAAPEPSKEEILLTEIRDLLKNK